MVIAGIHLLGASQNASMYAGKSLSWVRESAAFRPWQTWRVPIAARPAQEVRWRDVVIVDERTNFYAVQNLTDSPITNAANRTRLKNTLRAAASIVDSDADGLNDRWEFSELGGIHLDALAATESGLPALAAYAFGLPGGRFSRSMGPQYEMVRVGDRVFAQMQFRRRLGLEGQRLGYRLESTSNGGALWMHDPAAWVETARSNPYDGTGTEIVTVRRAEPASTGTELFRIRVGEQE